MDMRFKQPVAMSFAEIVADDTTHLAHSQDSAALAIERLRTAATTIYDYLLEGHAATDADGYAIAMEVYAAQHAKLIASGYEPAVLFGLCAERITARIRERALIHSQAMAIPSPVFGNLEVR